MTAPTLYIRLTRDIYAVRVLPPDLYVGVLIALARTARDACPELEMCLHYIPGRALYFYPNGTTAWHHRPPRPAEIVEFRPACLAFLPGPGTAPEEEIVPAAAPAAAPPDAPAVEPPTALIVVPLAPAILEPFQSLPTDKPKASVGWLNPLPIPWLILAGVAARVLIWAP